MNPSDYYFSIIKYDDGDDQMDGVIIVEKDVWDKLHYLPGTWPDIANYPPISEWGQIEENIWEAPHNARKILLAFGMIENKDIK